MIKRVGDDCDSESRPDVSSLLPRAAPRGARSATLLFSRSGGRPRPSVTVTMLGVRICRTTCLMALQRHEMEKLDINEPSQGDAIDMQQIP